MEQVYFFMALVVGFVFGSAVVWLLQRNENRQLAAELRSETERRAAAEAQVQAVELARQQLAETFRGVAGEALRGNSEVFLGLAETKFDTFQKGARRDLGDLVTPLKTSLEEVKSKVLELEKERIESTAALSENLNRLLQSEDQLRSETAKLVNALRNPTVRGRWGEMLLQRTV